MATAGHLNPIIRCYHCRALVRQREAQAITVEAEGVRRWTPERAAHGARDGQAYVYGPVLEYLCRACDHALFPGTAQPSATVAEDMTDDG